MSANTKNAKNKIITTKQINMKLEIVKETKINGDVLYSIELDGVYVPNSVHLDLSKVQDMFDMIVKNGITKSIKETIKTTEI